MIKQSKQIIKQIVSVAHAIDTKNFIVAVIDICLCGMILGASPNNYLNFDFAHCTWKQRKTFLTHRDNVKLMKRFNDAEASMILENKYSFASDFSEYYNRRYYNSLTITEGEIDTLLSFPKIIYKPIRGGQGRGCEVINTMGKTNKDIAFYLNSLPEGIVEEWIKQHEELDSFYSDAINPIRIQTLNDNGKIYINSATLTIGNGTAIANASSVKAIFALIDVETGEIVTEGVDYNGNHYKCTPETYKVIKGSKIPYWEDVKKITRNAAKTIPDVGYIGWDVAITPAGPILIEGNNDAGYTAYQLYDLTKQHKGIRSLYKKYL